MRILITGGTGLVGKALLKRLDRPRVLSRSPERVAPELQSQAEFLPWDPLMKVPSAATFEGINAVVHLAGEPIAAGRWTPERKKRILESRVLSTRHLVQALTSLVAPPRVLIAASAIGYYGNRGDEVLSEDSRPGTGFLADVCGEWEDAAYPVIENGIRLVNLRLGLVLTRGDGALERMLPVFRRGLGGPLGSGRQWMSWIDLDDLIGLILHLLANQEVSGPVNATAPNPLTNREFTHVLGRILHRPAFLPVPATILRLLYGEMASVLLDSQRVIPRVALEFGYHYMKPMLQDSLADALS